MRELITTIGDLKYRVNYKVDSCGVVTIWNIYGTVGPMQKEIDLYEHMVNLLQPVAPTWTEPRSLLQIIADHKNPAPKPRNRWAELEAECKEHFANLERELEFNL